MKNMKAYVAITAVVFFWSGWLTISRYGVHSSLKPADITLLRYCTAFVVLLPYIITAGRQCLKKYPWWQLLVVGLGVGFPYTLFSFWGMDQVKAAHAGVVVNGFLPVFGLIAAKLLLQQQIGQRRIVAIFVLCAANLIMTGGTLFSFGQVGGILLLLAAALLYTFHMLGIRLWQISWKDVIIIVPVVNVLLYAPLWFFLPSSLGTASWRDIISQALYQCVVVNVVALTCVAYAIRFLGTVTVSLFMAIVPVTTAILAWIFLGETLNGWEVAGIAGCTLGLFLYASGGSKVHAIAKT